MHHQTNEADNSEATNTAKTEGDMWYGDGRRNAWTSTVWNVFINLSQARLVSVTTEVQS